MVRPRGEIRRRGDAKMPPTRSKSVLVPAAALLLWAVPAAAQPVPPGEEQPVALIVAANGAEVLRAGSSLPLGANTGNILFPGDSLRGGQGSATFLFCPDKSSQTIGAGSEVAFEANQYKLRSGELTGKKPAAACILPLVARSMPASQQHNGGSLTRTLLPDNASPESLEAQIARLPADQQPALRGDLDPVNKAIEATPDSLELRVARAALFDKYKLSAAAASEYRAIGDKWPDAVWVKSRLFVHDEADAAEQLKAAQPPAGPGKSYALLIGVSSYQNPGINPLNFAHQDALLFEQHLKSPRGGSLPDENVQVLINEQATTAAIRLAFDTLLKAQAGKNDSILVFFASHGTVDPESGEGFIVTYDSDPQDLAATGLPMADLQNLIDNQLAGVGRVQIYVDVCHAGKIGTIEDKKNRINNAVEDLAKAEGEMVGFMASRPREVSFEGPQFGGGHGAFSYFLLNALNGAADYGQDGVVTLSDMIDYVQDKVEEGTYDRQHPREFGDFNNQLVMSRLDQEGVKIVPWQGADPGGEQALIAAATGGRSLTRSIVMPTVPRRGQKRDLAADIEMFRASIDENRILPGTPNNAFSVLSQLRRQLPKQDYLEQSNQLRVALEMRGQQVLLSYLKGEQEPQKRDEFLAGAAFFEQAKVLTPESLLLDARSAFCLGRVAIFDKDYQRAEYLLERAARIDPTGAYSYNALGIAYLEQANYDRAVAAFQDAVKLAPRWAYPYHNLALAYSQLGDFRRAIETYQRAIQAAPEFAYLPYNLGLLYQQLNRTRDAERAYREAIAKADSLPAGVRERQLALAHNALGFLKASDKRPREAEELYRQALAQDESLLEARHNLAVLLAGGRSEGNRFDEAVRLWRENLAKNAGYLPSRVSLARALNEHGRAAEAAAEYREVVRIQPDYVAARLALAALERGAGKIDSAMEQLAAAKKLQPENPQVDEEAGDVEMARGNHEAAMAAYQAALDSFRDKADRKRVRNKMRR